MVRGSKSTRLTTITPLRPALWQDFAAEYLTVTPTGKLLQFGQTLWAAPEELPSLDGLRVLRTGLELGQLCKNRLEPAHALALSAARRADAFPVAELSYAEAVAYLRREAVVPPVAGRGYTVVANQGRALGFVNHLGTRANNLYPPEWRIRSTYGPDAAPEVVLPVDSPKPQYIR